MKRVASIFLLTGILTACSPESYERSADLQVGQILKDRKQQTLDYTPQVQAQTTIPREPPKKAYDKIPQTAMIPPMAPPITPAATRLPYGPLGPELLFPDNVSPPRNQSLTAEVAARRAIDRLQLGPPAPGQGATRLDLFMAIEYAVQHSRPYQDRMEELYLAALDVTLERHLFDPRPFAQTGVRFDGNQSDYNSAMTAFNTVGVKQQLPYGGEVVAKGLVNFVQAIGSNASDGESAAVVLNASLPLLRGAGLVNLEPLIQSERSVVYVIRNFEAYRRSFAVSVASGYFSLLTQQQGIINRRMDYASRSDLAERTQALYAAGRISFLQVQLALQALYSAENALLNAQESYQSAVDDFKLVLGMPVEEDLDILPVELLFNVPDVDNHNVIDLAVKYRLELQNARDQIEDAQRQIKVAENGLLPELNLTGSTQVGNLSNTPASAFNSRSESYSAAVTLDLPLDRVAERNVYRKSLILMERSQRSYVSQREQVINDVREAVRRIHQAQTTLEIQRRQVELARRRVDFANELLTQGKASARDVADAQDALLPAQDALNQARADLQIQILQFLRDTGTLRVDPQAGALGQAMDRAAGMMKNGLVPGDFKSNLFPNGIK